MRWWAIICGRSRTHRHRGTAVWWRGRRGGGVALATNYVLQRCASSSFWLLFFSVLFFILVFGPGNCDFVAALHMRASFSAIAINASRSWWVRVGELAEWVRGRDWAGVECDGEGNTRAVCFLERERHACALTSDDSWDQCERNAKKSGGTGALVVAQGGGPSGGWRVVSASGQQRQPIIASRPIWGNERVAVA